MKLFHHENVNVGRSSITRRGFLHGVSAAAIAGGTLSFRDVISLQANELRKQNRAMILLWMAGGPSQFETFDPKRDTNVGGPTKSISTAVPGIQIAEGWEQLAAQMNDVAIVRSMTNKEGSHPRASYQMHTGYLPSGSVKHPSLASNIAQQIANPESELPSVVSVGQTQGAGFLGVDYEPFVVNRPGEMPQNVASTVAAPRYKRRLGLLDQLEGEFANSGGEQVVESRRGLYRKASAMVLSQQTEAFKIDGEPEEVRQRYGDSNFGRSCLMARRLIEAGVTFVEIVCRGWDTHDNNFERTTQLAQQVDPATATLIQDLKQRGLLDSTLVVWSGEFGRTPRINARTGRDHYPRSFNLLAAGGGVRGGQVVGATEANGSAIADRPVSVSDLFCSICHALKVDPRHESISPLGRPMKLVDGGEVVTELFH
ncbi:MAG: DUF1501 domain-containing protein [Planctomycetaceae bacterium]